jgi:hypothetical protein
MRGRITPGLEREIRQAICRVDVDGFYLNRGFWLLDGWIDRCGYFPSWNLRLFGRPLGENCIPWMKNHCDPTPFGTGLERKRWVKKATMRTPFRASLRFV